ncbi:MAG: YvcK family protein [Eubacteriaceae bacterium]|nr:YvcK family protein [Eubacteriaceae bacterium]
MVISEHLSDKKIVLIGGGTGSSVFLKSLKQYTKNITAIVAVSDDGGSTGFIRSRFNIVAPGDIRNCIVALADEESPIKELMDVRFTEGPFKKQSFGNIMLAAMNKVTNNFPLAVKHVSEALAITGKVLPVTTENVVLKALASTGKTIRGESRISAYCARKNCRIEMVRLVPEHAMVFPECLQAVGEADIILLCPGSLYTSLIPNLLVGGMQEALSESKASKYWVMNIMTQNGETIGYSLAEHVRALKAHAKAIDLCDIAGTIIYNTNILPSTALHMYNLEGARQVAIDLDDPILSGYKCVGVDSAISVDGVIRHDPDPVWRAIIDMENGAS